MIRCTWTAPTEHTSGRPAKPGDLVGYMLRMRVDGAPSFTEIAAPGPQDTEYEIDVNDPGTYEFELVARSSNGRRSEAATGTVTIADETPLRAPVLEVHLV